MILLFTLVNYISGKNSPSIRLEDAERIEKTKALFKEKWKMIRIVTILYFRNLY